MKTFDKEHVILTIATAGFEGTKVMTVAVENDIGAGIAEVRNMLGFISPNCFAPVIYRLPSPAKYTFDWECDDKDTNLCTIADSFIGREADDLAEIPLSVLFDSIQYGEHRNFAEQERASLIEANKQLKEQLQAAKQATIALTLDSEGRVMDVFTDESDNLSLKVVVQDLDCEHEGLTVLPTMEAQAASFYAVNSQSDRDVVGVALMAMEVDQAFDEPVTFSCNEASGQVDALGSSGVIQSFDWSCEVAQSVRSDYVGYLNTYPQFKR
ncbi:hypothetical protein F7U66_01150 [Vibrio parahaemolyticus]|nr:hypothetical protein [Vibrio parahaemolyticus]